MEISGNRENLGTPGARILDRQDVKLLHISKATSTELGKFCGRWVGMLRLRGEGKKWLSQALDELKTRPDFDRMGMPELCNYLVEQGKSIKVLFA